MNEYQKQKVKIKENPVEDKPPDEDADPKENIDENNEGGGKDEQTDQGN